MRPQRALLLNGFMGTGKSTVGRLVAERAGVPFVDLDERVAEREGASVAELFAQRGETGFRAAEKAALDALLAERGPRVIALGGGALLERATRRSALERACVITLGARIETIVRRTRGSSRPLLSGAADPKARISTLLEARGPGYAEAHARVATDDRDAAEVAADVIAAWEEPAIAVPLGERSYAVRFPDDATARASASLRALAPSSFFVVTDENVARHWGESFAAAFAAAELTPGATVVLPPGEEHKRLAAVERALSTMVDGGADRASVVVAHGGGVVSDVAGFTAATLLRGVRWIAVPTTLLAMVDASVGGKTGVDLGTAKNAVGAFHQPSDVFIDPRFVSTQSRRDFVSGLAEVVKTACIGDPALFELLEREAAALLERDQALLREVILRSVAVKAGIVARDERESGERALLNFGHTVGHALEAEGAFSRLTHGEAVSLGMVAMLRVGAAEGVTSEGARARVVALLERLDLPVDLDAQPLARALPLLGLDKKRTGSSLRAVLLSDIGRAIPRNFLVTELAERLAAR
jgi:shikimate kinase / 3-dehydroquinate synthase